MEFIEWLEGGKMNKKSYQIFFSKTKEDSQENIEVNSSEMELLKWMQILKTDNKAYYFAL